jgi:ankyrin repeat protein
MNEVMLKLVLGKDKLYPHELEKQFPRIVNKIIELWDTPQMEAYFLDLMVDKRGGRQGFPAGVATEIYYLSQVYDRTRKLEKEKDANPWASVDIKKQQEILGKGYQFTPQGFLKSAEAGDKDAVLMFLASGIDINTRDERGWTPLMISSFNGNEAIAELLIRSGADVHAKDNAGYGPMHWAAFNGYHKVIQLLLGKGANPNAQSNFGWTPLMQAATRGHLAAVKQLIDGRANPNLASKDGWTALHKATSNGHAEVVKLLLSSGANPDMRYQDGSTALSIATKNRNEALIALLGPISHPVK